MSNETVTEEQILQNRRRANLKVFYEARGWTIAELIRAAGREDKGASLLRDVFAGRKSFGEKLARGLERKLGMKDGELDWPARDERPLAPKPRPLWPFPSISPADYFEKLDDDDRRHIEDTVRTMVRGLLGESRKKKRTAPAARDA